LGKDFTTIAPARRHGSTYIGQHSAGDSRNPQGCGVNVQGDSQHAASYVAANSLRVDQGRRSDDNADAHIGGQMHVWHHGHLLNIGRAPEAFDGL
jgi:hypothetical protein